ncbi:hypothetical protein TWF481_011508 [Arthrobotrys musiformis]|uniref:Uncharacterized protein n=1 Tax=Arthrobotrys musiformis TaxID=47236 RepID=A0AAV9VYR9_9PEZI
MSAANSDQPVKYVEHPPPAGLEDMEPLTRKQWSLWMELVYDTLIDPEKYSQEVYSKGGKWVHPQLKDIDPTNQLCRSDVKYDPPNSTFLNPNYWGNRKNLTHFINERACNDGRKFTPAGAPIQWTGFPKIMDWGVFVGTHKKTGEESYVAAKVNGSWLTPGSGDGNNVYWQADQFRVFQDEYLEWAVTRDENGHLKKATFTCEGPEYWRTLAKHEPEKVVKLYQSFVPESEWPKITKEALWTATVNGEAAYNPENEWNSPQPGNGYIAHLIHPNSTLADEVEIVAQATIKRPPEFEVNEETLCVHGGFGEQYRNSDPTIGWSTYGVCDMSDTCGTAVSLGEPIGLYIQSWDSEKFKGPEGFDISECWQPVRPNPDPKSAGPWVRVEFRVPDHYDFGLEALEVADSSGDWHQLKYGSQIAEHITIGVGYSTSVATTEAREKPAYDPEDWERLKEVIKDPKVVAGYKIDRSQFWHYMSYKVFSKAGQDTEGESAWYRWSQTYNNITFARRKDGGDTGDRLGPVKPAPGEVDGDF